MTELNGIVDLNRIYVMGHSAGGLGAMVASTQESRVKGVVALSPPINVDNENLPKPTNIPRPIMIIVGSEEQELYQGNLQYYNNELVSPSKNLVVIRGGNHIQFMDSSIVSMIGILDDFMELPYVGNQPANCSVEYQHTKTTEACIPFLNSISATSTPTPNPTPTQTPTLTPTPTTTSPPGPTSIPTPTPSPSQSTSPSASPTPSPKPASTAGGLPPEAFIAAAIGITSITAVTIVASKRQRK
jgi:hypothetical protein